MFTMFKGLLLISIMQIRLVVMQIECANHLQNGHQIPPIWAISLMLKISATYINHLVVAIVNVHSSTIIYLFSFYEEFHNFSYEV